MHQQGQGKGELGLEEPVLTCTFSHEASGTHAVANKGLQCHDIDHGCAEDGDSEGEQGMREPLLMALDGDEGSVGSEDTTNCSLSDFGDFESRAPGERREGPLGGGSYVVDSPEVSFKSCEAALWSVSDGWLAWW